MNNIISFRDGIQQEHMMTSLFFHSAFSIHFSLLHSAMATACYICRCKVFDGENLGQEPLNALPLLLTACVKSLHNPERFKYQ